MRKLIESCKKSKLGALIGLDRSPSEPPVTAGTEDFCSRLESLPPAACPGDASLALCRGRAGDGGEDSCVAFVSDAGAFMGVFDGCGGSGAKVYPSLGGHTGAWVASRALALTIGEGYAALPAGAAVDAALLHQWADDALGRCRAAAREESALLGSLSRAFPTTVALFCRRGGQPFADFFWCGDSRGYLLDGHGLHQVTADDTAIGDAMRSLREDAPMSNVASASRPYCIHARRVSLEGPSVLLAATDGCFGYLPSPMAFERLLLETMRRAQDPAGWKSRLEARLGRVAGDDFTLTAWMDGFGSFNQMKRAFGRRLGLMREKYPLSESEEALFEQWDDYKPEYERLMNADAPDEGRV